MVVEAPCLDVVLGQLGVGEQLHGVWHQLHVVLIKLFQLQVNFAHLSDIFTSYNAIFCKNHSFLFLDAIAYLGNKFSIFILFDIKVICF